MQISLESRRSRKGLCQLGSSNSHELTALSFAILDCNAVPTRARGYLPDVPSRGLSSPPLGFGVVQVGGVQVRLCQRGYNLALYQGVVPPLFPLHHYLFLGWYTYLQPLHARKSLERQLMDS
ncbi:hypothetical protein [Prochlorococcus sp. MIT 1341]|uniref:hypothetical protein n=1 Tax=Prochlorococcus sp. MIT 1341 TaxID=3096221 RepID=UPI002A75B12F|nr:hypothetical protein [Prochlorococcus sp. MIT 1341]